jgi:hypothetical protein
MALRWAAQAQTTATPALRGFARDYPDLDPFRSQEDLMGLANPAADDSTEARATKHGHMAVVPKDMTPSRW